MKKVNLLIVFVLGITFMYGQTLEELKGEQAPKKDSIAALQTKVHAIQG